MTDTTPIAGDDNDDGQADHEISVCLDLKNPVSFFLFADAGSGKTRSLVNALNQLVGRSGKYLRLFGQRIAVITYTNAASDEISRRLEFDPLVAVSTIHSFVWSLVGGHNADIKQWLRTNLKIEINELEDLQRKGKTGSKAALVREESIKAKKARLADLDTIRRFTYNPAGENRGRDSLSHSEVIKIGASFLTEKQLMQRVLVTKFPVLLIDESQDTNRLLMEALLRLQSAYKERFCLGLFGDVMQRIYADGKEDLGRELPSDWARPSKKLNHRCPRRIIKLINRIRSYVDGHEQKARADSEEGFVRIFVVPSGVPDKEGSERAVAERMAAVTGDPLWTSMADVKTLVLENHMAARRMGFGDMFNSLDQADVLQTGLRDGSLPGLRFFAHLVLPLVKARSQGDEFTVAAIVRGASPLLNKTTLKAAGTGQQGLIRRARAAVEELSSLWSNHRSPSFLDVLLCVSRTGLFEVPESLAPFASREGQGPKNDVERGSALPIEEEAQTDPILSAWDKFLGGSFEQIEPYDQYVSGKAAFETHQGVKGLEFERVMVVIDDAEARGFMFNYEKLFGAKEKTKTDVDNENQGKDSSLDRTRRLFYVTCSRAKRSLAIVAYSSNPDKVRDFVVREGWFEQAEVQTGI